MILTDNQDELFDVVNERDQVIGKATRREVHANKSLIHRSIGVLVFNSKNELLLQKRSASKDTEPLQWTISCSGHVPSQDSYEKSAKRELKEELGIQMPFIFVSKFICKAPFETELCTIYKGVCNGPFIFHPQEIKKGAFNSLSKLKRKISTGELKFSFMGKLALQTVGIL